ncbi:hypothetical protein WJX74_004826 [Apatococcus lobatus]|uniref:Uncharacterized protein n=1 Tax=Apatococcus lobatus TaxID=904363 RepID=A0AAW1Q695_9CHLO
MNSSTLAPIIHALGYTGLTYSLWAIKEEIGASKTKAVVDFKQAFKDLLEETTVDFQFGWFHGKLAPFKFAKPQGKDRN